MLGKMLYLVSGILVAAIAAGCATTVPTGTATAGTVYFMGSAEKTYQANVEKTYNAALEVLEGAGIPIYAKSIEATKADISGTFSDGKKVTICMDSVSTNATEVKIRVGTFGDVSRSNFLIEKMNKRLE